MLLVFLFVLIRLVPFGLPEIVFWVVFFNVGVLRLVMPSVNGWTIVVNEDTCFPHQASPKLSLMEQFPPLGRVHL